MAPNTSDNHDDTSRASNRLGRIIPARQLRIVPTHVRISDELERVRTIEIGAAVLIAILGLIAWPWGLHVVSFVFVAGIIIMIIGMLTGRTTILLRNYLAQRRAKHLGQITFTGSTLIVPRKDEPFQFQFEDPHTLLRSWQRVGDDPPETIISLLIAQDGDRAILYSSDPISEEEARDYGFRSEERAGFQQNTDSDRLRIPKKELQLLSRMIDESLQHQDERQTYSS